ncbi:MAG: hypothetical protein AAAC47_13005 [Pararhizobium sp.]
MKIPEGRRRAIEWFATRGEVAWFDNSAPSAAMRRAMIRDGQLEKVPDSRIMHVQRWRLTDVGRSAISKGGGET